MKLRRTWVLAALALAAAGLLLAGEGGTLNPGDQFPAWQLTDHTGAPVSSRDLAGKSYLLWFYPRAMSEGCTAEGCALRDAYAEYEKAGIEILGVSFDPPGKNAEFVKENRFPFRLLTDADKSLAITTGAARSDKQLGARRISYLVGPDGKVLKAYDSVDPATHARQVLDDVTALRTQAPGGLATSRFISS